MLIVGENLRQLVAQAGICEVGRFDGSSLLVLLGDRALRPVDGGDAPIEVAYGLSEYADLFVTEPIAASGLVLKPNDFVLVSTRDHYSMPHKFVGVLRNKSTVAKLGLYITLEANRVDPGWVGALTLEIKNLGRFAVTIRPHSVIAALEIWEASTSYAYSGRYAGLPDVPAPPLPDK